jgi:hypothetical protein
MDGKDDNNNNSHAIFTERDLLTKILSKNVSLSERVREIIV